MYVPLPLPMRAVTEGRAMFPTTLFLVVPLFQTREEAIWTTQKSVTVLLLVTEAIIELEVTSGPVGKADMHSFTVRHLNLMVYAVHPDLNMKRSIRFNKLIHEHAESTVYDILYGSFKDILKRAIEVMNFPQASHANPYGRLGCST